MTIELIDKLKSKAHSYFSRNYGVILNYHSIIDIQLTFDLWTHLKLSLFEEHMRILKNEMNVISLREFSIAVKNKILPPYSVAVTFDDGFANNYTRALPIIKKFEIPVTIFLTSNYIGSNKLFWPERLAYQIMKTDKKQVSLFGHTFHINDISDRSVVYVKLRNHLKNLHPVKIEEDMLAIESILLAPYVSDDPLYSEFSPLTWEQVQQLENEPLVDFGGHTSDHYILGKLSTQESISQIKQCKEKLQKYLTKKIDMFAYPNGMEGDFTNDHSIIANNYGFYHTFSAISDYVSNDDYHNNMPRWGIGCKTSKEDFYYIINKRDRWKSLNSLQKFRLLIRG